MKAHNQPPADRQPIVLSFVRSAAWANRTPDVDSIFTSVDSINARDGFEMGLNFLDSIFQLEPLHMYRNDDPSVSDSSLMHEHGLIDRMCPDLSKALMSSDNASVAPFIRENAEGCLLQSPSGILTPFSGPMMEYAEPKVTAYTGENGPELVVIGERSILRETNEGPLLYQRFAETFVSVSPTMQNRDWIITDFSLGRADIIMGASSIEM